MNMPHPEESNDTATQLDPLSFPLHDTRLIEASAGTGKTYTIAALYLRLVLGHGGENGFLRPLTPPEILVVTFTNAATEELRDRIRVRLAEAAAFFRGQGEGDDFLIALRKEFSGKERPGKARLLEQAAQWMDESAIHTIHAWCQRMLKQHAFDSGSLFDLELENDEAELLEEAACDYWRCHFYPLPPGDLKELTQAVKCRSPQDLLKKALPLLNAPATATADPFSMLQTRCQAIERARHIWQSDFDNAVNQLERAHADKILNGSKYRKKTLERWIDQLRLWVNNDGPLPESGVLEKLSASGLEAGKNKGKMPPQHAAYEAFERLQSELEGLDIGTALIEHAARDIARRFQEEKKRRGRVDFDDLLTRLRDALQKSDDTRSCKIQGGIIGQGINDALQKPGNTRLARVIAEQFPVAMIDEFQDTDPVQYDIFSRIYLQRENTGLFMIGDPKQAIYAFRGADIYTYLEARGHTEGRHYTLGTNYRSTEGIVHSVNRMFEAAAKHPQGAFMFKERIPFEHVAANGQTMALTVEGKAMPAVNFRQLPQSSPVNKTGDEGYVNRMAQSAAAEIVRLLNLAEEQPPQAGFQEPGGGDSPLTALRPADIAVLVRDRNEAAAIREALRRRGMRSVYLSDKESVFDGGEAASLLYLLRACAEPERENYLKTALATDIIALPLSKLDRLNRDETTWENEVERFRTYQRIWRRRGVLPMLRALLLEFGVPSRLLGQPGGERVLTNLLHLAELLQSAASALDGQQGLIRWLAERLQQPGGEMDEQILRLESDEELVRVITIHKSKGLEYPLVFLPFICSYREVKKDAPLVTYHDEDGKLKRLKNPAEEDLQAADRERLAEDLRLLYVALTRAIYSCWLGIGVMGSSPRKGEKSNLHRCAFGYLLAGGEPILTQQLSDQLTALKGDCEHIAIEPALEGDEAVYQPRLEESELTPAARFGGEVPRNWWIASYSGLLAGASMPQPEARTNIVEISDMKERTKTETTPPDSPDSAVEEQLRETAAEASAALQIQPDDRSIHTFPRGPRPGTFLHNLLEMTADEGFNKLVQSPRRLQNRLTLFCEHRGWDDWTPVLTEWLPQLLQTPFKLPRESKPFTLGELKLGSYQAELEFLFAAHEVDTRWLDDAVTKAVLPGNERPQLSQNSVNGMLKGFIDLVFHHNGRYYVLDYKSNYLGENEQAYDGKAVATSMLEHRYDLQYVLYTLALHRLLKARVPHYDYRRDVGGVIYLFLRGAHKEGQGVYTGKPPRTLIDELDTCFAGKETDDAA